MIPVFETVDQSEVVLVSDREPSLGYTTGFIMNCNEPLVPQETLKPIL